MKTGLVAVASAAAVAAGVVAIAPVAAVVALRVAAIAGASDSGSIGYGCGWIALRFNRSRFSY